jgi:Zn-dependent alcohol dehydrogenase
MKVQGAVLRRMAAELPYANSRPLQIETLQLDPPGPGEVLLRTLAAGLCHSDLSVVDGSRPRVMPMLLGHEAAGEVVELGAGVDSVAVGDRVVFSFVPHCGHCAPCSEGRAALCEPGAKANIAGSLLSGARRLSDSAGVIHHHLGVSGFATHTVASARSLVRIDRDLDPAIAALFGCAVLTGVGAVVNTARVAAGESVAIFGLGGVGMAVLLGARAAGAHPIIAIDRVAAKLEVAKELGATSVVLANGDANAVIENVRALSRGGAQHVFETVGSEVVLADAYAATRRGGSTITLGLPDPTRKLSISAVSLVIEERTLKGSYMGSAVPSRDIPRFIAMHRAGQLPVERLLTHRLRLEDINEGFDRLRSGDAIRQIVDFG